MEAISGISQALGKLAPLLQTGLAGGGFLSNWLQNRKTNANQDYLTKLGKDPVAMQAYMRKFQQPLSAGLTQNVGNQTQAFLGERGLSESPTISQDVLAQALAPYQQQEQKMGEDAAFQSLGLIPTKGPAPANLTSLLAGIGKGGGASPSSPTPSNPPDPTSSLFDTNSLDLNSFQGATANG